MIEFIDAYNEYAVKIYFTNERKIRAHDAERGIRYRLRRVGIRPTDVSFEAQGNAVTGGVITLPLKSPLNGINMARDVIAEWCNPTLVTGALEIQMLGIARRRAEGRECIPVTADALGLTLYSTGQVPTLRHLFLVDYTAPDRREHGIKELAASNAYLHTTLHVAMRRLARGESAAWNSVLTLRQTIAATEDYIHLLRRLMWRDRQLARATHTHTHQVSMR